MFLRFGNGHRQATVPFFPSPYKWNMREWLTLRCRGNNPLEGTWTMTCCKRTYSLCKATHPPPFWTNTSPLLPNLEITDRDPCFPKWLCPPEPGSPQVMTDPSALNAANEPRAPWRLAWILVLLDKHSWKVDPGKGDPFWKPSFSGSMLNFGAVPSVFTPFVRLIWPCNKAFYAKCKARLLRFCVLLGWW